MKAWHHRLSARPGYLGPSLAVVLVALAAACTDNGPLVASPSPSGNASTTKPSPSPSGGGGNVGDPSASPGNGGSPSPKPSATFLQSPSPSPTPSPNDPKQPIAITVSPSQANAQVWSPPQQGAGGSNTNNPTTLQFDGFVTFYDQSTASLSWSSSDTNLLTINNNGLANALFNNTSEPTKTVRVTARWTPPSGSQWGELLEVRDVTIHYEGDIAVTIN